MNKILKILNYVESKFMAFTLLVMIAIVFLQVALRFIGHSNSWSEELSRYIYLWECWVGLSFCQKYHEHIRITALLDLFPPLGKKIMELIVMVMCGAFTVVLIYLGLQMVGYLIALGTATPYMRIPYWIVYAALPVGCIGYILRLMIDAYALITGKDVEI
jgi:TRAP-type C4-dicarboxylate transport system permease small subunit